MAENHFFATNHKQLAIKYINPKIALVFIKN